MPEEPFVILVVDDDPSFCAIMKEFLKGDGFEVHLAYDVPHALSLLESLTPDLILADIMMPDIDGLWLLRNLRSKPIWADIPTIVVSARTLPEERTAAKEAGADAFVSKPFSFGDLRTMIRSFLPRGVG
jgi:two-component system response regulator VicR